MDFKLNLDEMDFLDCLGIQKERLDKALGIAEINPNEKVKILYSTICDTQEQADARKLEQLKKDLEKRCKQYIEKNIDTDLEKMIRYRFGDDDMGEVHILRRIYEKIETYVQEYEIGEVKSNSSFCVDKYFTNLSFNQFCPACSGMIDIYKTGLLKKYATYQRCSSVRNKSFLTFTTVYRGRWVRISVTSNCHDCCDPSDNFSISSTPVIENANDNQKLLLDDPAGFVKNVVIKWLERICLK